MKKVPTFLLASIVFAIMALPQVGTAEEFSLFGVKMGMSAEEVDTVWKRMDTGEYYIEGSVLSNLVPEFDHRNRLYRLSFTTPIPLLDQHPGPYVSTAFQETVQSMWASDSLTVSLRTGRGNAEITLTSRPLQEDYADHVKAQMVIHITEILKH